MNQSSDQSDAPNESNGTIPSSFVPSSFDRLTDQSTHHDTVSVNQQAESLFEVYEPRSSSSIVAQQIALRDSQAAEAAGIILEGVDLPDFDPEQEQFHQELLATNAREGARRIRVQKTSPLSLLLTPGAQFVYALVIITLLGGLIGLAASIESPALVLAAGIISPILLPICIWKWIRWLDSRPYYYRLLTSLGEDARNLLAYRLLWKRASLATPEHQSPSP